jgi:hypothetical protein
MNRKIQNIAFATLAASAGLTKGVVNAALVISASVTPNVTMDNGTYDVVTFSLTGLTGVDDNPGPVGQEPQLLILPVVFTAFGSAGVPQLGVPGDSTAGSEGNWTNFITNNGTPPPGYRRSFANFPNFIDAVRNGAGTSDAATSDPPTMITGNSVSFGTTWAVNPSSVPGSDSGPDPVDNTLLARVLVTPGDGVSLRGQYGTYGTNTTTAAALPQVAVSYVPGVGAQVEPNAIIALTSFTGAIDFGSPLFSGTGPNRASFNPATNFNGISVTGGNGVYQPAFANNINNGHGDATNFVDVTGFSPTDPETFAMKLLVGSSAPSPAQMSTIISDINAANIGVTALEPTPDIATAFPGYQLELTSNSTTLLGSTDTLSFDFTQETNVSGVVVTDIVAVPEPASIAGLILGSSSLLLRRRRLV